MLGCTTGDRSFASIVPRVAILWLALTTVADADSVGRPITLMQNVHSNPEAILMRAIEDLRAERLDLALERVGKLVRREPTFRLAQLVYGDLLLAKSQPLTGVGGVAAGSGVLSELLHEAQMRVSHHRGGGTHDRIPANLVRIAPEDRFAVVVETDRSRLYIFENVGQELRLLADFYAGVGKNGAEKRHEGDQRTPTGVYFVNGQLFDSELPELYGAGALPIDYPNAWDRRQGYTGYGIWLHGVPRDTYSRPPLSSDGCVTLANDDFEAVRALVDLDTPVVIARSVDWQSPGAVRAFDSMFSSRLERWRTDWESLDFERYARNYSTDFEAQNRNLTRWLSHRRRLNSGTRSIAVDIDDVTVLTYPGLDNVAVVVYYQHFRSDRLDAKTRRQQYWRLEADGQWRIIYEASV